MTRTKINMNKNKKVKHRNLPVLTLAALALLLIVSTVAVPEQIDFPRVGVSTAVLSSAPRPKIEVFVPQVSARAAIVVDPASGVILFEKNPDLVLSPASTTKMITAYVALQNLTPFQVVEVPEIDVEPQVMKLVPGEKITVRDLLYGTLVWSANDAAEALTLVAPGGRDGFIARMNEVARRFGMQNTHFVNPTGFSEAGHISTARDLARFAGIAMQEKEFAKIVGTENAIVTSIDGKIKHKLVNLNELLGKVPGVLGIKTGWTEEAGGALVSYVSRGGHPIIVVVLGTEDRFGDSQRLIEWAYANYQWTNPINATGNSRE